MHSGRQDTYIAQDFLFTLLIIFMFKFSSPKHAVPLRLLSLLLLSLHAAPAVFAQIAPPKPSVFVTVNGEAQSMERAKLLLGEQVARGVPNTLQLQNSVREAMIAQTLMAQEAVKAGLDKQAQVKAQLELSRQSVLAQAWQTKITEEKPVTDADIEAEYQRQVALLGNNEVRLRHLMVAEEPTANLLMEKVLSGAKIADLAGQYSRDEATRQTGGLTNWVPVGQLYPALADSVKDLAAGKLAPKVVKGATGWHVVQLEDRRAYTAPTLEASKPQLMQAVMQQRIQERLTKLRQTAKVE